MRTYYASRNGLGVVLLFLLATPLSAQVISAPPTRLVAGVDHTAPIYLDAQVTPASGVQQVQAVQAAPGGATWTPPTWDPYYSPTTIAPAGAMPVSPLYPTNEESGLILYGEYLYWQTSQPLTPYTLGLSGTMNSQIDPIAGGFDRDIGFRAGVGYLFQTGWDMVAEYTYFFNEGFSRSGDRTIDTDGFAVLNANVALLDANTNNMWDGPGGTFGLADEAAQAVRLDYDTYDLQFGRNFNPTENVWVRPYGGFRYANIEQFTNVVYANLAAGSTDTYGILTEVNMDGWGFEAGAEGQWRLFGSGFGLFARGGLSMLLSGFSVRRTDSAFNQSTATTSTAASSMTATQVVPVLELAAGVRYARGPFFASGGYEFANWFNMVHNVRLANEEVPGIANTRRSVISVDRGDLSFSGWFGRAGFVF